MGQKLLTWIRLIMICYIVLWWPSPLSDLIAFSNSESDVVWRVSRLPPWPPSWILELNVSAILNLCHCHASHQVLAQSDLQSGRCYLKNSWISEQKDFSNSESLCPCDVSHQVSAQSDLRYGRRCRLKNFKMATMAAILDIGTEQF